MKATDLATKKALNFISVLSFMCLSACGQVVYDAAEADQKPLAAVVADESSGVVSVYKADESGNVELSGEAKTALAAAQNAANSSGNAALIALASIASALAGAGASFVAANRKKKASNAEKTAETK